jgi:hypothetical protein
VNSSAAYVVVAAQAAFWAFAVWQQSRGRSMWRLVARRGGSIACGAAVFLAILFTGPEGFEPPGVRVRAEFTSLGRGLEEGQRSDRTAGRARENTVATRLGMYRVALAILSEKPIFGGGMGHFGAAFPEVNRRLHYPVFVRMHGEFRYVHNDWLQLGTDLGMLGLAAIAIWWAMTLWRTLGVDRTGQVGVLAIAAATSVLGYGVNALFAFPMYNAVPPFLAAAFAGIVATQTPSRWCWTLPVAPRVARRWGSFGLTVVALLGLAAWRLETWVASHHLARVMGAVKEGAWAIVDEESTQVQATRTGQLDHVVYWAQAKLALGDPEAALELVERLLRRQPHHPQGTALKAVALGKLGESDPADEALRTAVELLPWEARLHLMRASLLQQQGRSEEALAALELGLEFLPEDEQLRREAALLRAAASSSR